MTPEAREFRNGMVQTLRARMLDPRYTVWRMATELRTDSDAPKCMFWRDLMLVGSVLRPEDPAPAEGGDPPAFYLDDPAVRALIHTEVSIPPRLFLNNCDVNYWAGLIPDGSFHRRELRLDQRFYVVDKTGNFGWFPVVVPLEQTTDEEGNVIDTAQVTLPTFEIVSINARYAAMGM